MIADRGPVVHQALLIRRLVQLRRERSLTQEDVASRMECSHAKIMRYEGGSQVLPKAELDALLSIYGVANTPTGRELQSIGQKARQKPWWHPLRHVMNPGYRRFAGFEMGADRICQYQPLVVPGLLQTRDYAHSLCSATSAKADVEDLVAVRMGRQGVVMARSPAPQRTFVLDEGVIRRPVGHPANPGLMVRQLHHLMDLASAVSIRIVPEYVGLHFGLDGGFTLLGFSSELPDVLYTEHRGDGVLSDKENYVRKYDKEFDHIATELALNSEESLEMIESYAKNGRAA
ncbi:helix-turn-helix domain-containing protein [Nocardiopsis sp. NPDC058631]|uniref:helix-turn-helix domain-containing protein n=1 Tax=Nocardiopsis sp. NPDC058631 TaxID=3346566 RepID=UPI00364B1982